VPELFGDWTAAWGRAAVALALERQSGFDGVICGSDRIVLGVLDVLRQRGIDVPRQVSVVGVDNWLPLAEDLSPALTTVDLGLDQLGRAAARSAWRCRGPPFRPRRSCSRS
jgi:LacI family transcriptional regulator